MICCDCLLLLQAPGSAIPRDRTPSSSNPGPGPLSILRPCGERCPHQEASCHQVWFPSQPAGGVPSSASWVEASTKVGVRGWGKGRVEGQRGRKGRKRSSGCKSRLAPGVPSPPTVQRSRRGRPSPDSLGLYGTVPSRPPRGPGRRGGGIGPTPPTLRLPPPPPTAIRLAGAPGDVRGTVGSPRTKEMLIARQDWG